MSIGPPAMSPVSGWVVHPNSSCSRATWAKARSASSRMQEPCKIHMPFESMFMDEMFVFVHVYVYIYIYVHQFIKCTSIYIYVNIYIYIYYKQLIIPIMLGWTETYIYIYIHTNIYIYIIYDLYVYNRVYII